MELSIRIKLTFLKGRVRAEPAVAVLLEGVSKDLAVVWEMTPGLAQTCR